VKNENRNNQIFITGFPNFVAVKLVKALAEQQPRSSLHVLVMDKHRPLADKLVKRL
jgi:hypothetical protein